MAEGFFPPSSSLACFLFLPPSRSLTHELARSAGTHPLRNALYGLLL